MSTTDSQLAGGTAATLSTSTAAVTSTAAAAAGSLPALAATSAPVDFTDTEMKELLERHTKYGAALGVSFKEYVSERWAERTKLAVATVTEHRKLAVATVHAAADVEKKKLELAAAANTQLQELKEKVALYESVLGASCTSDVTDASFAAVCSTLRIETTTVVWSLDDDEIPLSEKKKVLADAFTVKPFDWVDKKSEPNHKQQYLDFVEQLTSGITCRTLSGDEVGTISLRLTEGRALFRGRADVSITAPATTGTDAQERVIVQFEAKPVRTSQPTDWNAAVAQSRAHLLATAHVSKRRVLYVCTDFADTWILLWCHLEDPSASAKRKRDSLNSDGPVAEKRFKSAGASAAGASAAGGGSTSASAAIDLKHSGSSSSASSSSSSSAAAAAAASAAAAAAASTHVPVTAASSGAATAAVVPPPAMDAASGTRFIRSMKLSRRDAIWIIRSVLRLELTGERPTVDCPAFDRSRFEFSLSETRAAASTLAARKVAKSGPPGAHDRTQRAAIGRRAPSDGGGTTLVLTHREAGDDGGLLADSHEDKEYYWRLIGPALASYVSGGVVTRMPSVGRLKHWKTIPLVPYRSPEKGPAGPPSIPSPPKL